MGLGGKRRVHVFIAGRVQGVFFRESTRIKADEYGVSGLVRNLRDGRVEVLAEGEAARVKQMVDFLKEGPPRSKVNRIDIEEQDYVGEFNSFSIAR